MDLNGLLFGKIFTKAAAKVQIGEHNLRSFRAVPTKKFSALIDNR